MKLSEHPSVCHASIQNLSRFKVLRLAGGYMPLTRSFEWRGLKVNTVGKVAGTLRGREEIEDSGMIAFRASGFFLT